MGGHDYGTDCDTIQAAISADMDGEDPGVPGEVTGEHLAGCAACRAWQQRAHSITRRARLGGYALDHDLAPGVLAALPAPRKRQSAWLRAGLLAAALAQFATAAPLLILGHDHDAGLHAAHELGSFDLALAIAFAVGAVRPALSAGLAWPCGIAALGLAGTAVADLAAGQALGADEAQHLVAIAGALLLAWQARLAGSRPDGHAQTIRGLPAGAAASPDEAPREAVPRPGPRVARETRSRLRASGVRAG